MANQPSAAPIGSAAAGDQPPDRGKDGVDPVHGRSSVWRGGCRSAKSAPAEPDHDIAPQIRTFARRRTTATRAAGKPVDMLILHYTGMPSAERALKWLCDPESGVSSHYFVFEDGRIAQLVDEDRRAWHAGKSFWAGETDINSRSIGIEIANPGPRIRLSSRFPTRRSRR